MKIDEYFWKIWTKYASLVFLLNMLRYFAILQLICKSSLSPVMRRLPLSANAYSLAGGTSPCHYSSEYP